MDQPTTISSTNTNSTNTYIMDTTVNNNIINVSKRKLSCSESSQSAESMLVLSPSNADIGRNQSDSLDSSTTTSEIDYPRSSSSSSSSNNSTTHYLGSCTLTEAQLIAAYEYELAARNKRRKLQDIPDRERWRCSNPGCNREYKRTSTTSIGQHKETCPKRPIMKATAILNPSLLANPLLMQQLPLLNTLSFNNPALLNNLSPTTTAILFNTSFQLALQQMQQQQHQQSITQQLNSIQPTYDATMNCVDSSHITSPLSATTNSNTLASSNTSLNKNLTVNGKLDATTVSMPITTDNNLCRSSSSNSAPSQTHPINTKVLSNESNPSPLHCIRKPTPQRAQSVIGSANSAFSKVSSQVKLEKNVNNAATNIPQLLSSPNSASSNTTNGIVRTEQFSNYFRTNTAANPTYPSFMNNTPSHHLFYANSLYNPNPFAPASSARTISAI